MFFPTLTTLAIFAASVEACSMCTHPGNFTGGLSVYTNASAQICLEDLPDIAASVPASFWDPRDEAPCGMTITVTNPDTGSIVIATVVGQETNAVGDAILLTTSGLAALAPDADPDDAPETVDWTFVS